MNALPLPSSRAVPMAYPFAQGAAGEDRAVSVDDEIFEADPCPRSLKGYLLGIDGRDSVFVHPQDWYPEHDVELRLGGTGQALQDAGRGLLDHGRIDILGPDLLDRPVQGVVVLLLEKAHDNSPWSDPSSFWSRCRARCRITAMEVCELPSIRAISRLPSPSR